MEKKIIKFLIFFSIYSLLSKYINMILPLRDKEFECVMMFSTIRRGTKALWD